MESTITAGEPANQQHEPEEPVTPTVATSESESAAAEKTVETETVAANSNEMLPTATMESAQNEDGDLVSETVHVSHLMGKVSLLTVRKYDSGKPKELINDIAAGDETIALIAHVFRDAVNNKEWLARGGIQLRALLKRDKDAGTDDSLVQVVYHVGDQAAAAAYWFKENQRHRSCPVSIDERNRVLKLQIGKQFSDNKIADVLGVCQATIAKWRQRLEKTGDVKPSSVRTGIDGRKRRVRAKKKGPTGDSPS